MDFLANLSYLDAFIAVSGLIGAVRGWATGLVDQVLSIVGIVVAIILSAIASHSVGALIVDSLDLSPRIAGTIGFAVTFAAVMLGVHLIIRTIKATMAALALGGLDKVGGAAFGTLKALLVVSLSFALLNTIPLLAGATTPVFADETREDSRFYEPVRGLAPIAWDVVRPVLPVIQERLFQAVDDLEAGRLEEDPAPQQTAPVRFGG